MSSLAEHELLDAMRAVLLDLGENGQRVRVSTKARARLAFERLCEPQNEDKEGFMRLADARKIVAGSRRVARRYPAPVKVEERTL